MTNMEVLNQTGQTRLQDTVVDDCLAVKCVSSPGKYLHHGPLVVVADNEVVQRKPGGPHFKRTWWTEESIGTASGLWLQIGADGELLLPIVLTRTGGSKC